jgi:hypothetical protein
MKRSGRARCQGNREPPVAENHAGDIGNVSRMEISRVMMAWIAKNFPGWRCVNLRDRARAPTRNVAFMAFDTVRIKRGARSDLQVTRLTRNVDMKKFNFSEPLLVRAVGDMQSLQECGLHRINGNTTGKDKHVESEEKLNERRIIELSLKKSVQDHPIQIKSGNRFMFDFSS